MIKDYGKLSFYEIYPLTFQDSDGDGIGDIQGIIDRLDYIKSLGFSALWINPLFKSAWHDGGYDIIDYYHVDPRFGTDEDARRLIKAAHDKGLAIFFDLVPGHMSWDAPEFQDSAKAEPGEWKDLFIWTNDPWTWYNDCCGNLVKGLYPRYGSFWVNFFVHQPALNYGFNKITHPEFQQSYRSEAAAKTRRFLADIMVHWLEQGVDGFRVDMADSLVKNDDDKEATIWTWQQIIADVKSRAGDFDMVSEWSTPERSLRAGFSSDFVLDHDDNFSRGFFRLGTLGNPAEEGKKPLLVEFDQSVWDYNSAEMLKEIRAAESHPGKWISPISGNHDTFRLADSLKGDSLKLAYLMVFTLPGVPFVFAGDEAGQTTLRGYPSKEGGYQRTGTRLVMKWDDSNSAHGFSKKPVEECYLPNNPADPTVADCEDTPDSILNFIRKLNGLRLSDPDLTSHEGFVLLDQPLSYRRGKTSVFMNLKKEPLTIELAAGKALLTVGNVSLENGKAVLPLHAALVWQED